MVNNKRGHRAGKKKKETTDTGNVTTDMLGVDTTDVVQVALMDVVETSEATHVNAADVVRAPAMSSSDTTYATKASCSTRQAEGIQLTETNQQMPDLENQLTEANEKTRRCTAQLAEAHQKIYDYEAFQYQLQNELKEREKSEKKSQSEHAAQIKERDGHVRELQDVAVAANEGKVAARKEVNEQKSISQSWRDKHRDCQSRLASASIELHNAKAARESLSDQLRREKKENEQLRGHNEALTHDHQQRMEEDVVISESVNTLMNAEFGSQQDTTKMGQEFQAQKEEIEDLKRQVKALQSSRSRIFGSEDGSDLGSRHRSNRRPQQPRMLSQELEGKLSDDEEEEEEEEGSMDGHQMQAQSRARGIGAAGVQLAPAKNDLEMLSQSLTRHSASARLQSDPYSSVQDDLSFNPNLQLHNAPHWPKAKGVLVNAEHRYRQQVHKIWRTKDCQTQTISCDHKTQPKELTNQAKNTQLQVERGTQTDTSANRVHNNWCQADIGTQTDEPAIHPDNGTQTDEPAIHVDNGTQTYVLANQADNGTQTCAPTHQVDNGTQTQAPAHQVDDFTQTDEPAKQVDEGTQTYAPAKQVNNTSDHANGTASSSKPKGQAEVATQIELYDSMLYLGRLNYQYWFFIIATYLLLLLTAFAFYHGLQARGERAMWLAANDYSRRAVIYHRSASARGMSLPWLTIPRMKDLSVGYGGGLGRYGVEM